VNTGDATKRIPNATPKYKRTEQALCDGEAQLRAITNAIPNIAWSTDASGKTDYINDWDINIQDSLLNRHLGSRAFL